ncbi:hypothetical protein Tco_0147608, partial [Tanacetum coccineum]
KEKMMMYKQAEQGIPLQAEQADWLADTDEEIDEQENWKHITFSWQRFRRKGLKRQKEAKKLSKTDKKREKDKESRARQRIQPEITAGSARHSQTQSKKEIKEVKDPKVKSRGHYCQIFKDSRANWEIERSRT